MRLIDADHLISIVQSSTILGSGFQWAFVKIVEGEPTVKGNLVSSEAVTDVLKNRWKTTERYKKTGRLVSVFWGGLSEILDDIKNLPGRGRHGKEG